MTYIIYALLAHCTNAIVFAVDKGVLVAKSKISQPIRYAAISGLAAGGAGLILFVSFTVPTQNIVIYSFVAGLFWIGALFCFFTSLSKGEPSVVVPIAGSAVPLFTFFTAAIFLNERLSISNLLGVFILIAGGLVLSVRWSKAKKIPLNVISTALFSGLLFALYFATVKHIYDIFTPFLAAFAYSRLGVGFVALLLMVFLLLKSKINGEETTVNKKRQTKKFTWTIIIAFLLSKGLAVVALLLQNYAISLGSVTVVNSLQGTQYLFLLFLSAGISRKWPAYREELSRVVLTQKIIGIACISIGLIFLTI